MMLGKYSIGIGDRFAHEGRAQLEAFQDAAAMGVHVVPVWNKSHREHTIVKTVPADVRKEADAAVQALGWTGGYFCDADHIGLKNVDLFLKACDFYTLDVADFIGKPAASETVDAFVHKHQKHTGTLRIPGIAEQFKVTPEQVRTIAGKFLLASQEAGRIYRRIESVLGKGNFVTEVSMDEAQSAQTPLEMFFILAALADEKIPAQTIAPKFTGRFNKGVDYVGDLRQFEKEFGQDLDVISFAVQEFGLPRNLKLSVHSGSDKFSIYGIIGKAIRARKAGLHLKTAGTTWLEEIIGLAAAGGDGLATAKDIYAVALSRFDELCAPYATVIDIRKDRLPSVDTVRSWDSNAFAGALRHDRTCREFNPDFRQLLHVGYKVAAEMGDRFLDALKRFEGEIARNVKENLLERHIKRVFLP